MMKRFLPLLICVFVLLTRTGNAKITFLDNSTEYIDVGDTAPKRLAVSRTSGWVTGALTSFGPEEAEKFCGQDIANAVEHFRGKILLLDGRRNKDFDIGACWNASPLYSSLDYMQYWCRLGNAIVMVEDWVPGLFSRDHDGMNYSWFKLAYPDIADECILLEIMQSTQSDNLFSKLANGVEIPVNISIDVPVCIEIFDKPIVQIWMRGVLGLLHLYVTITSFVALFGPAHRKTNQFVSSIVLSVNCLSTFTLALALLNGGWRISSGVSVNVSNFLLPAFVGSHGANDFLLALRWNEILVESKLSRVNANTSTLNLRRNIVILIAFIMIAADLSSSLVFVFLSKDLQRVQDILPRFLAVMQLFALGYLWYEIRGMVLFLRKIKYLISAGSRNQSALETFTKTARLVSSTRFWGSVSVAASATSLCILLSFSLSKNYERSCDGWILHWSALLTAQIVNCTAQTRFCTPATPNFKVQPNLNELQNELKADADEK